MSVASLVWMSESMAERIAGWRNEPSRLVVDTGSCHRDSCARGGIDSDPGRPAVGRDVPGSSVARPGVVGIAAVVRIGGEHHSDADVGSARTLTDPDCNPNAYGNVNHDGNNDLDATDEPVVDDHADDRSDPDPDADSDRARTPPQNDPHRRRVRLRYADAVADSRRATNERRRPDATVDRQCEDGRTAVERWHAGLDREQDANRRRRRFDGDAHRTDRPRRGVRASISVLTDVIGDVLRALLP